MLIEAASLSAPFEFVIEPTVVTVSSLSAIIAKALTLPLMSTVHSPAGIIIPAFATEAEANTAAATASLILLFICFSLLF